MQTVKNGRQLLRILRRRIVLGSLVLLTLLTAPLTTHAGLLDSLSSVASDIASSIVSALLTAVDKILAVGLAFLGSIILLVAGTVLTLAGKLFNLAVDYSVNKFADLVSKTEAINDGWSIMRDLVNVLLIFIILYIGIRIILRLSSGGGQKLLARVVIIALLVNFSAFFTKVIIDASNVLANEFYSLMVNQRQTSGSALIAEGLAGGAGITLSSLSGSTANSAKQIFTEGGHQSTIFVINEFFGKSIIQLTTAFALFTGIVLIAIRMVVLIVLTILSPLAFAAYATPGLESYSKQWWQRLLSESFWFPLYLFFIFIASQIIKSPTLTQGATGDAGIVATFKTVIVLGLIFAAIITAKKLGATGASAAMLLGGMATGGLVGLAAKGGKAGSGLLARGVSRWAEDKKDAAGNIIKPGNRFAKSMLATGGKIRSGIKGAEKLGRKVAPTPTAYIKKALTSPLTTAAEGLAMASGVSIMGRTRDEKKAAKEREKQEREERTENIEKETRVELGRAMRMPTGPARDDAIKVAMGKMTNKQIGEMEPEEIEKIAPHLKKDQLKTVMDRKDLTAEQKRQIKETRFKKLRDAADPLRPGHDPATAPGIVKQELSKMSPEDVADLDEEILTSAEVVRNLNRPSLLKIMEKKSQADRQKIKRVIEDLASSPSTPSATQAEMLQLANWLEQDPVGKNFV